MRTLAALRSSALRFLALGSLTLLALAPLGPAARAQRPHSPMDSGGPLLPEQAAFDVTHYGLAMRIDPAARTLAGTAAVTARLVTATDGLLLDLDTVFAVTRVAVGGSSVRAERRPGGRLWIPFGRTRAAGETVTATVTYAGAPRVAKRPPWDGGFTWATTADGRPWIATSVQGEGADLWWPCKDHPSDEPDSLDLAVTVPAGLVVAANGRLRGVDEANGERTYRWHVSTPINNYGVALNIAPYVELTAAYTSTGGEPLPVTFWVLPEREADGRRMLPEFVDHLRFYESLLGPYPWRADKYGVAHTPHLGMEHQTIIAYGARFDSTYAAGTGFDNLHHHELGHEWWGNLVTVPDWNDFWIHEGFCSYMQPLYIEQRQGRAAYLDAMRAKRRALLNVLPLAPRGSRSEDEMYMLPDGRSNGDIYSKGAVVLHALRYLVGDSVLFRSLRRFAYPTPEMERVTDGRQARFATTDDYAALVNALAGRDLTWFFEVYARQPALPRLVVRQTATALALRWEVPGGLPFPRPVDVVIDGALRRVDVPAGGTVVTLPRTDARVEVDPSGWVLREGA